MLEFKKKECYTWVVKPNKSELGNIYSSLICNLLVSAIF